MDTWYFRHIFQASKLLTHKQVTFILLENIVKLGFLAITSEICEFVSPIKPKTDDET